ncbi:MAG: metallophosphoesterase [Ginsengibacter sp.]
MAVNRRKFIQLSLKGAFVISAGHPLQSFTGDVDNLSPANKVSMRFAIASDGHYGQDGTKYDLQHDQMIQWINAEKHGRGIDFTVINGDLFHNNVSFLPIVKKKWDQLEMPYYVSHGNHDQADEANWKDTWNMLWHHSFENKDVGFLVLNTADATGKYICADVEWTKFQLQQFASKKHVFVFMHITPFNWTKNGLPCPEIVELFNNQDNLKAVFHGHDHDMDDVKENNGKYYFFDAHIGGSWGTVYNGYRIVEVLKNGKILTYQVNPLSNEKVNSNNF